MSDEVTGFKPPSISFQTFWNFVTGDLASKPLPPQLDRSIMGSKSGTDQINLINALTNFKLLDRERNVQPRLTELVGADDEHRKELLAGLLRDFYPEQIRLSDAHDTAQKLTASFRDQFSLTQADTTRKAVTFFLHAMGKADLYLSPNFPKTRPGSGAPGVPKKTSGARARKATERKPEQNAPTPPTAGGDSFEVSLASGGSVKVSVDIHLFGISEEDRTFVMDLVDRLRTYAAAHPVERDDV